jgi:hypothetical protein
MLRPSAEHSVVDDPWKSKQRLSVPIWKHPAPARNIPATSHLLDVSIARSS